MTELNPTVCCGKQGVVSTATNIVAGVELGSPLTKDDAASRNLTSVVNFDSKSLRIGITAVAC